MYIVTFLFCSLGAPVNLPVCLLNSAHQVYIYRMHHSWEGGGDSHMKGVGMVVGNFELIPKGD